MARLTRLLALLVAASAACSAQGPANVLVVVNDRSDVSKRISEYYALKRAIPPSNLCHIQAPTKQDVTREEYNKAIADPIGRCLRTNRLMEQVFYIVTTSGVPLRVEERQSQPSDGASVDSELTLLYGVLKTGRQPMLPGFRPNPFFGKRQSAFTHAEFPIYLVTRLTAYDYNGVRKIIDQSLAARNRGKFVVDLKSSDDEAGNNWLRTAALSLPADRVLFEDSEKVVYGAADVIGYAGWGSNDKNRRERFTRFQWLPGGVATEFVSTNGRTFEKPPANWSLSDWSVGSRPKWFFGSPQTLTADYLLEGATAATGHVFEPYLQFCPRPDYFLPAYFKGRNLAESFYLSIPALSWQNIVVGDPLMSLGAP